MKGLPVVRVSVNELQVPPLGIGIACIAMMGSGAGLWALLEAVKARKRAILAEAERQAKIREKNKRKRRRKARRKEHERQQQQQQLTSYDGEDEEEEEEEGHGSDNSDEEVEKKKENSSLPKKEQRKIHVQLRRGKLDLNFVVDLVRSRFAGAISTFSGTTRLIFDKKIVTRLEYEAYESMAVKEMEKIADEVAQKWPEVMHVAIEHKLGECPVLDTSVVIAVSSERRAAAIEATKFAIDALKANVPIWKKETYENGGAEWKSNKEFFERNNN